MSYSYSAPLSYDSSAMTYDSNSVQHVHNSRSAIPAVGGFIVGAAAGTYAGVKKIPYFNGKNEIKDTFAKSAHKRYMKKAAEESERKAYSQWRIVIEKLKRIKDADSLNNLLNSNPLAKEAISEDLLKEAADVNIKGTKASVKETLLAKQTESIQKMRNKIARCWDSEKKEFIKPDDMSENTFKAIRKAAKGLKIDAIAKYALITGAVTAIVATVISRVIDAKKNVSK